MTPELSFNRNDFEVALRQLHRVAARGFRGQAEAVVAYQEGDLSIMVCGGGAETSCPATGAWPGRARIPAKWLWMIVRTPLDSESYRLRWTSGRVELCGSGHILTCSGSWEDISPPQIPSSLDMGIEEFIHIALSYT